MTYKINNFLLVSALSLFLVNCSLFGSHSKKESAEDTKAPAEGAAATSDQKTNATPDQGQAFGQKQLDQEVQVSAMMTKMDAENMNWTYTGDAGPKQWGAMKPTWQNCSKGNRQSPINLVWRKPSAEKPISFNYSASLWSLVDNGRTLQVNFSKNNKFLIDNREYELNEVHFHSPSEHKLSKRGFPMEVHLKHSTPEGDVAMVAIFIKEGSPLSSATEIWNRWPKQKGVQVPVPDALLNPADFLPARLSYYEYQGSLTSPPCTEGVRWVVLNTPLEMSMDQLTAFRKKYSSNNRPLQPINGRNVTNYP